MGREIFRVILPAGQIPAGATVTKVKGEVEYILRNDLRIFAVSVSKKDRLAAEAEGRTLPRGQTIFAPEGHLFLVGRKGDVNTIPASQKLIWHAPDWALKAIEIENGNQEVEVFLPVGRLPENAVVRKISGSRRTYRVLPSVKVGDQEIKSLAGCLFLVDRIGQSASAEAVRTDCGLIWVTTLGTLSYYLAHDPQWADNDWKLTDEGEPKWDWEEDDD